MGLDTTVAKIVFAFIFALILIWVIRPAIQVIGMVTCSNCSTFLNAIFFIVVPIGAVFVGLYKIMSIFTSKRGT